MKQQVSAQNLIHIMLISIFTFIIYLNTLHNSFQYDDHFIIVMEPNIQSSIDKVFDIKTRPITYLSYWLNYKISRLNVWSWHTINIEIHILNCVLIYFLTIFILRSFGKEDPRFALYVSFLFAIHPLNTEPVNYISARSLTLCTFFYLLSLLLFIAGIESVKKFLYFAFSLAFFSFALLCKEAAATLPITAFLYFACFKCKNIKEVLTAIRKLLIPALTAILLLAIFMRIFNIYHKIREQFDIEQPLKQFFWNILTQGNIMVQYLLQMIYPIPQLLCVDHNYYLIKSADLVNSLGLIAVLLMIITAIAISVKNRLLTFAILWIFITHLPTSIVPRYEMMVDYRNYLPLFGFCIFAIFIIRSIHQKLAKKQLKILFSIALFLIAGLFCFFIYKRNTVWKYENTLWQDTLSKSDKWRAHFKLGMYHSFEERFDQALEHFETCLDRVKDDLLYYNEIGIRVYKIVVSRILYNQYIAVGQVNFSLQKFDRAISHFKKAIEIKPDDYLTHIDLANVYIAVESHDLANETLNKAISLDPKNPRAYIALWITYYSKGEYEKSLIYTKKFKEQSPDDPYVHAAEGDIYLAMSQTENAIRAYKKSLELKPDQFKVYYNIAMVYWDKLKDNKSALEYLRLALAYTQGQLEKRKVTDLIASIELSR